MLDMASFAKLHIYMIMYSIWTSTHLINFMALVLNLKCTRAHSQLFEIYACYYRFGVDLNSNKSPLAASCD